MSLKSQMDRAFISTDGYCEEENTISKAPRNIQKPILDFDPNSANFATLLASGIPKKIASNMLKYRANGGYFRDQEALKKIYGMDDELYTRIQPHIIIYKNNGNFESFEEDTLKGSEAKSDVIILEINQASRNELEKLKGIGPSYAKWIVKYRERLGGFTSRDQLLEVYRIEQSTLDMIKPFYKC